MSEKTLGVPPLCIQTELRGATSDRGPNPTVSESVYVTLGAEVNEQMFWSGDQSEAKAPVFNSQESLALIYRSTEDYEQSEQRTSTKKTKTKCNNNKKLKHSSLIQHISSLPVTLSEKRLVHCRTV
ncbi:hypothetical protein TNCV_3058891 [Trichonephila clavipes]|nr:hypothetical protein TNCV_3058891 [Trichonephila clavipes]